MKSVTRNLHLAAIAIMVLQNSSRAEDSPVSQVSQVRERLRQQGYKIAQQLSPPRANIPRRSSFYERALILGQSDGSMHAIVPLGSVLHLPDHLRDRILREPQGKLVPWETLLKHSKTWLGTQEISQAAARGDNHEIDALTDQLASERRIIIAVIKTRPVPVLQPANSTSKKPNEAASTPINSR
jgi:hypothetical protein